ncbi:hypothetical protein [Dactylosporangium sp. CA-139066]|uniref:hypothetical protein n=1 Tax=Dactylosporangium sp. CA-139066 TaxID=3239930 RepID=UPI003D922926
MTTSQDGLIAAEGSVPRRTIELVRRHAGRIRRRRTGGTPDRHLTEAERVALEFVEAILTPAPFGRPVPDELY